MNGIPCSVEQADPSMVSLSVESISSWSVPSLFYTVVATRSTGDDTGAVGGLVPHLCSSKYLKPLDMMQSDITEYLLPMEQQFKYQIHVVQVSDKQEHDMVVVVDVYKRSRDMRTVIGRGDSPSSEHVSLSYTRRYRRPTRLPRYRNRSKCEMMLP